MQRFSASRLASCRVRRHLPLSRCKVIVVSYMLTGAGSVALSARPILPRTLWTSGNRPLHTIVRRVHACHPIVDNFFGRHFAPPERAFLPFRKAKSALALAPEGVTPQNVKMGMTKCAPFLTFFDPILTPF